MNKQEYVDKLNPKSRVYQILLEVFSTGEKYTKWNLRDIVLDKTGVYYDPSSIMSRKRELELMGHKIETEAVKGKRGTFVYYIPRTTLF